MRIIPLGKVNKIQIEEGELTGEEPLSAEAPLAVAEE